MLINIKSHVIFLQFHKRSPRDGLNSPRGKLLNHPCINLLCIVINVKISRLQQSEGYRKLQGNQQDYQ